MYNVNSISYPEEIYFKILDNTSNVLDFGLPSPSQSKTVRCDKQVFHELCDVLSVPTQRKKYLKQENEICESTVMNMGVEQMNVFLFSLRKCCWNDEK